MAFLVWFRHTCMYYVCSIIIRIATRYGLDSLRIESQEARFSAPVQTGPGAYPSSYSMGTGSFPGVNRAERGVDHLPHLTPRLRKEQNCTSNQHVACFRLTFSLNVLLLLLYNSK
jgi:hypothetical protein